jgi:hypothetical protein
MSKRIFGVLAGVGVVGAALAGGKKSDPDTLARVGAVVGHRVKGSLPDGAKLAGPLVAFHPGDALPVEEKVRLRIHTDKAMGGADIRVVPGESAGEVKLRGVVPSRDQWKRAGELAEATAGVQKVVNELAVPE